MFLIFKITLCSRYQYADDTTFFVHSKTKDLAKDVVELNDAISRLGDYSSESNIALNEAKTNKVDVINQKRVRVFDRGIQTPRNR